MEEIRGNYELGLLIAIEVLGNSLSIDEMYGSNRVEECEFSRVYGYITAGMYADIISFAEFEELMREVRRWQFA